MADELLKQAMTSPGLDLGDSADTMASIGDDAEAEGSQQELPPGSQAGRYLILDQLGRGGMGVVYKAYDPELDRRVALKLLSVKKDSQSLADRARDRLLREAQALAKLSHPNVVSAFDVGTLDEDVFVAMELVEGKSLGDWIREEKPDCWQTVTVMVAAGRGIAAAHQAGLIHRDIKPDNIIVGDDGRVRVLDFGLARAANLDSSEPKAEDASATVPSNGPSNGPNHAIASDSQVEVRYETSKLLSSLTLDGTVMGTPGYMAPEQYLGGSKLDEHTDQYSFCVTLYEALYGSRPHRASTFKELKTKVTTRPPDPLPGDVTLPSRLRRILLRGLSIAKPERFPNMDALLAELSWDPRTNKRRVLSIIAAVVLLALGFGGAAAWQAQRQRLCQGAEQQVDPVWGLAQKKAVRAAFVATEKTYAPDTFLRVEKILNEKAAAWVAMRTEACEATHIRGEQSQALLDKRMQCLDRRLGAMQALTHLFATGTDGEVLEKAVKASFELASLKQCADAEALSAAVPPPEDPAVRVQVKALHKQLDRALAFERAGKIRDGLAIAITAAQQAESINYAPAQAEAFMGLGLLQSQGGKAKEAEETLNRAIDAATAARDDQILAQAALEQIYVVGYQRARYDEALGTRQLVAALVKRSGNDPSDRGSLLSNLGVTLWAKGSYAEAQVYFEQALSAYETGTGKDSPLVASALNNLGNVLAEQKQYQAARKHYERAKDISEKIFGPDHPDLGRDLINLSTVVHDLGDAATAQQYLKRALAILTPSLGPNHPLLAAAENNLGDLLNRENKFALALPHCQSALRIGEAILEPNHPIHVYHILCLARSLIQLKRFGEAVPILERALALRKASSQDPTGVAQIQFALGEALWGEGTQKKEALLLVGQARETYAQSKKPQKEKITEIDTWLARVKP